MVRIKLTLRELKLLLECYNGKNNSYKKVLTDFDNDEIEKIIDDISNYFIKVGLNKNDEPNEIGFELENLNDKFITVLQDLQTEK